MSTDLATIDAFLALPRVALVGASHDPNGFSRVVMNGMLAKGYDVVPVNRKSGTIADRPSYPDVASIPGGVDFALVMVPAVAANDVLDDCARAGVRRVWLHRGAGPGATSPEVTAHARALGLDVVDGECPLMFIDPTGPHAVHGALRRLGGSYPEGGTTPAPPGVVAGLATIQGLVGVSATVSGALLVADPTGALLGLPPDTLAHAPFGSFLVPGVVLLGLVGVARLVALGMTLRRHPKAPLVAVALALVLFPWIGAQWLWLTETSWLQPAVLALAAAEIVLSLSATRARPVSAGARTSQ